MKTSSYSSRTCVLDVHFSHRPVVCVRASVAAAVLQVSSHVGMCTEECRAYLFTTTPAPYVLCLSHMYCAYPIHTVSVPYILCLSHMYCACPIHTVPVPYVMCLSHTYCACSCSYCASLCIYCTIAGSSISLSHMTMERNIQCREQYWPAPCDNRYNCREQYWPAPCDNRTHYTIVGSSTGLPHVIIAHYTIAGSSTGLPHVIIEHTMQLQGAVLACPM